LEYDIIIIGARVAGSIVATLLGEAGHRVLVLDRATFPSDTLSTHFFRAPSFRAFEKIGVFDEVQATAPRLTVNYNVIDGIVFPEPVDRPDDYPFYLCIRRITLDDILVRRTKKTPNVELREGALVNGLLYEDGRVSGVRWKEAGQKREATAKAVVGADGLRSFLAKEVEAQAEHEEPVHRAMYFAYYRGIEAQEGPAAEFHYFENSLAYCFPSDNDLTLLAVSVPIDQFKEFKRDPEGRFWSELESMSDLAPRLGNAEREGPVQGTGSIPGYLRIPYGEGWALVGDAGMVMDPWSGQGIDQASTHAVYLAGHLGDFLSGEQDWETAMRAYHKARNEFSLKAYRRTSKFSVDLRPMTRAALERRGLASELNPNR
jgi:2-polyprenyl-6-methoxyphenol hydroxylase-like FAD-dependent oxidoreductase